VSEAVRREVIAQRLPSHEWPDRVLRISAIDAATGELITFDSNTGVGLVEPMRVEDAHSGRGVAGALLRAGLEGLAARGCTRLKVSHAVDNPPARRLYHGAGFRTHQRIRVLVRPGSAVAR